MVQKVDKYSKNSDFTIQKLIGMIGISSSKFYQWKDRLGLVNQHNAPLPKKHWLLKEEKEDIIAFALLNPNEGYRRLTYMMIDLNLVCCSPSSVYRVLKKAGMLNTWNKIKSTPKGSGYQQPTKPHQEWHTDIKYVNFRGTFLFLISVIDGYSRYIVHHELRTNMQEFDVQLTLQKARENHKEEKPRIISDNGSQFISKDFAQFIRSNELTHIRTSVRYPQSNGKIERFHRTIQQECISKSSLITMEDAQKQFKEFIEFYNKKRLHSSLYYLTPDDFLCGRVQERLELREEKLRKAELNRISKIAAGHAHF